MDQPENDGRSGENTETFERFDSNGNDTRHESSNEHN